MRILYVQETDWINRGPHQQHHLMERMSLRGHEVRVIDYDLLWKERNHTRNYSKRFEITAPKKVIKESEIKLIRPLSIHLPLFDRLLIPFIYSREIKNQIKLFQPHIIMGSGILNIHTAQKIAKKNKLPFIFYSIDKTYSLIPSFVQRGFAKYYEKKIMKNADGVIALNKGLRDFSIKMGCKPENVKIITGGVDVEKYSFNGNRNAIREKYGFKDKDIILFFMGWIYDFSGMKEVVLEFAKYKDKNPNMKLLIVGEGDSYNELQQIKEKYNLHDHVVLTGKQPFEKIPEFLAISDICLLPAYNNDIMQDIVPIKMYEYMAASKPVIATRLSGIMKEFGENGGISYINKPEEALQKSIELIKHGSIKVEGVKARKFVEKYDWNKITDEFEKILYNVLKE